MKRLDIWGLGLFSAILIGGSWAQILPLGLTEVLGFVTGALCVWLTVKENIWNWPIGLANNAFFIMLFWDARLFADMSLQVVYVFLGVLGWYWWLRGGQNKTALRVSTVGPAMVIVLAVITVVATLGMTLFLESVNDSAPFLDAFTTVLSLVAQFMLTKKLLQNWYVWITADVIYIGLYASKALYLTSGLYFIFLLMCVMGLRQWRKSLVQTRREVAMPAREVIADV